MLALRLALIVALWTAGAAGLARADDPFGIPSHYHGFHVGKRHYKGWSYPSSGFHDRARRGYYYQSFGWGTPYGYGAFTDARIPYGWFCPSPVYTVPPVFVPPELHFGPQALDRFLGLDRNAGLRAGAAPNILVVPPADGQANGADQANGVGGAVEGPIDEAQAIRQAVRKSNAQARQRADRFLQFGDNLFAQQRYHEALQRYKSAADAAPDLSEPYFRQAHALVATNRFDLAAEALRRALLLDDDVNREGFRLDDLYGDARLAKSSHLESLARQALDRPHDAQVLALLGAFLFHDGQPHRAAPFFERAAELLGERGEFLQPYVDHIAVLTADAIDL